MSGLLQSFKVESDTREQLVLAIKITQSWNKQVTHYKSGVDIKGVPYIKMQWHESGKGQPLMAPMTDAESIADQIYAWLKTVGYDKCYDCGGDGSNHKGWSISQNLEVFGSDGMSNYDHSFYDVFVVQPVFIYYGK